MKIGILKYALTSDCGITAGTPGCKSRQSGIPSSFLTGIPSIHSGISFMISRISPTVNSV